MPMTSQQLKQWRNKRGFTQTEASRQFGITLSQYQRLESGYSKIGQYIDIIVKLIKK